MSKKALMFFVGLTALPVGMSRGAEESMDKPVLEVTIAVPEHRGARALILYDAQSHFHVVVRNVSAKPVTIWQEMNSFGYDNLSFEYIDKDKKEGVPHKKKMEFIQNNPDPVTLAAGEEMIREVYFGSVAWKGFPLPDAGKTAIVSMRAVFRIDDSPAAKKYGVWTGKITSKFRDYSFYTKPK